MASAVFLLALTTFVCGIMMRDHLNELWGKLKADLPILLDAAHDLLMVAVVVVGCVVLVVVGLIVLICEALDELRLLLLRVAKVLYPILLAIFRFVRKWWWVPVVALTAYVFIWGVISTMQNVTVIPDALSFLAFLAMVVLVFWIVVTVMMKMPVLVLFLLGVFALLAGLMMLGVIGATLYGLVMLLGALIGLFIGLLMSAAGVLMKWIAVALMALALLLPSLIPSCGGMDGVKIPQMSPEVPAPAQTVKPAPSSVPFTVVSEAFARPGDGCIALLEQLGVTEEVSKRDLGTDRLSWCVANAQKEGRLTYWHSDPKRWEAPRVCLNEVPGKDTQPERWMLVIWPDGSSGIVMPPDSRLCTPRP